MQRLFYFILTLTLFSCNANSTQGTGPTHEKIYTSYDAIRNTILPPLFVLLTNKE